ncbi:metallophosphoesterase [Capnocytophaga canis]|uniref:metallophosphoesterase n=1 Tax=Capnocytophaga canis TaxID=1848903 RepID=UPI0037D1F420
MKSRKIIKKIIFIPTVICLFLVLYAWQIERHWVEVVSMKMPIEHLPKHLEGKTLMQISDLHTGRWVSNDYLISTFEEMRKYDPDFVVYTGDYVTYKNKKVLYDKLEEALQHCVKGRLGTIAVLGNHDYGVNWREPKVADSIVELMRSHQIVVLRNERIQIEGLTFIGLDDLWAGEFNASKAFENYDAAQANVVLSHNPDTCDLEVWQNYQGWILSGHTHGGQCKPPFLTPPVLPLKNKEYASGKIELSNQRTLYVNRGIGHSIPVRFNVRPEITIFELEKRK